MPFPFGPPRAESQGGPDSNRMVSQIAQPTPASGNKLPDLDKSLVSYSSAPDFPAKIR